MPLHYTGHLNAVPQAPPVASRDSWSLDQQFLTALAMMLFILTFLAMPVKNTDELSSRFGQEEWVAVWEINESWPPQWKLVAGEWAALAVGYLLLFKMLDAERRATQTFGWLRRAARERERHRHGQRAK